MSAETGLQTSLTEAPMRLQIAENLSLRRQLPKGFSRDFSAWYEILQKSRILRWNRVIGWVGISNRDDDFPHMGYRLKPEAQGKGNATKAAIEVREIAFELGADTIVLSIHENNVKSKAVAERIGAQQVPLVDSPIERWVITRAVADE